MINHYERIKVQQETQVVLDNIREAVITHTDSGINFINQAGHKIL